MAKSKCPGCKKRIDFELHGWICPNCGFLLHDNNYSTGAAPEIHVQQPEPRVSDFPERRIRPQNISRHSSASRSNRIFRKVLSVLFFLVTIPLVILLGIGIALEIPDVMEKSEILNSDVQVECTYAEMNDEISIGTDVIKITEAYLFEREEFPFPRGGKYIAVRFESSSGKLYDKAWPVIYDADEGRYVKPLYLNDIAGNDDLYMKLVDEDTAYKFNDTEGVLIFLVKKSSEDFTLNVYSGQNTGYGIYDTQVDAICRIPLVIEEKSGGDVQ